MKQFSSKRLIPWLMGLILALGLLPALTAPAKAAETEDKRAYYQIIMKDGTAIKLYPGETGGHCIRTNESKAAEPGGATPDNYVVKLVGERAVSTTYYYYLYLKDFKGQSITYCDGETGGPYNRDFLYIEVEGDNTLTAGAASLRDGVYTAIGRTILKGNQDITYRISNDHPAEGSLTIKAVNGEVSGMKKAYGIACQNLDLSGSAIKTGSTFKPGSFVLNINLSGNKTGDDRAITVTNRLIVESYASMILNVQGLNAVYNESKFYGNHTTRPPNDESKFTYFLIDTKGNVNVTLDAMGLSGRACAFYNGYYQDHNFAAWTDGVNELRKVGKMTVTVRNLNSDQLADARANPTSIWWVGAKPGWKTEDGKGLLLEELQADGTCIFEYAPGVTPSQIAKVIIYDGEIGNGHYRARAGKEYSQGIGTTIYAPITAPKIWTGIPFKCWTTVDGAPLNFTSADGATNGNLAVLRLEPKSTTKLLAMYDPFISQPKWQPVYNKTYNRYDGKITWEAAYGMQVAAGRLVRENYELDKSLEPVPVTDQHGRDVVQVDSGVSRFSGATDDCDYFVPEGRYRIALKDGRDNRWHYSEPFNISYALAEPKIWPEGGFPNGDTLDVMISSAADAEIWYRVYDDTTPTPPDAQLYTKPLEISVTSDRGTVVVEAYAIKEGKQSAWAVAKFSAKPAAPTVTLQDGTTAKDDAIYTYYDTAVITAAAPEGVEIRYGTELPSDENLGTKLGKDGKFSVSGGDGNLQWIYVRARKTIRSGNRTYSAWSDPVSFEMVRVADLTNPILKVNGSVMNSGSPYTVDGSATVTLTREVGCPVDAEIVYTDKSAIPSYCDVYTQPITISDRATTLDVYMRAWNSKTNCYDASPGATYSFKIKPGTTLWELDLTNATAYDSTEKQITQAYSGTVVTVKANLATDGSKTFDQWIGLYQYLENKDVEKFLPEVTFVMPDNKVKAKPAYINNDTGIQFTKVLVDMGVTAGNSLSLDDYARRSIRYSWWEGDKVGTEAEKLHDWMSFDPNKTYTAQVTITANADANFTDDTEIKTANRKKTSRTFLVPENKIQKNGKSLTFEIHPATKLALTLPSLHHGDKMPTAADIKGLPCGISVERMTWAPATPDYAGPSGTVYTISELVLNINGTCPQIFTSSTVNGTSYSRTYSAGNDKITLKDIKVPVVAEGVTVSGKLVSYNPNYDVSVRLMQGGTEMYTAAVAAPTAASGQAEQSFSFASVAMGTYDLVVVKAAHLTYTVKNVVVGDMALDLTKLTDEPYQTITMLCGDINGDGSINVTDLNEVWDAANFNKNAGAATNKLTDINGDGSVNVTDLNVIWDAANFNKGVTACTYDF